MSEAQDQVAKVAFELAARITDDRMQEVGEIRSTRDKGCRKMYEILRPRTSGNVDVLESEKGAEVARGFLTGVIQACWVLALYHVRIEESLKEFSPMPKRRLIARLWFRWLYKLRHRRDDRRLRRKIRRWTDV